MRGPSSKAPRSGFRVLTILLKMLSNMQEFGQEGPSTNPSSSIRLTKAQNSPKKSKAQSVMLQQAKPKLVTAGTIFQQK